MRKTGLNLAKMMLTALGLAATACSPGSAPSAPAANSEYANLGHGIDNVALTSDAGALLKFGDLKGRPRALYFGYTHCPVICPVTVYELTAATKRIGASADRLAIQFVTLDPEHDSAARLHDYFSGFENRATGYTGSAASLDRVARAFEVTYRKVDEPGGDYSYDHVATVFLIDASGNVVDVVGYGSPPELIESRLRALLARPQ